MARPPAHKERFRTIISDPCNKDIPRHEDAGKVIDGTIVMHNGIRVNNNSYYDGFSDIFKINEGVHEPQEEKVFGEVMKDIPDGATMIELGAYWGFYSLWFNNSCKDAKNYLIEPIPGNLQKGKDNFELNGAEADFTHGCIGPYVDDWCKYSPPAGTPWINIDTFVKDKGIDFIDVLHCDIQAAEYSMLMGAQQTFKDQKVKYAFISSHCDPLHEKCIKFLTEHGYEILASANVSTQSFSGDGIIVARLKSMEGVGKVEISNRANETLQPMSEVDRLLNEKGL